jgi:uncharacterized protein YodC (DUF2158 family)
MQSEFKPGDIVQLKSGGPRMTVSLPDEGYGCQCQWFVGDELKTGTFPDKTLQRASEQKLGI